MSIGATIFCIVVAAIFSLLFSTITYCLRDLSRARFDDQLERRGKQRYLQSTFEQQSDLIFVTALVRLIVNILLLIAVIYLFEKLNYALWLQYLLAVVITACVTMVVSVAIPHALARQAAEPIVASVIRPLHWLRKLLSPAARLMHAMEHLIARATSANQAAQPEKMEQEIEDEILSVVEEGEKEGVVDEREREMIERVIDFHDTETGQIMTPRTEIFAIEIGATLDQAKQTIAECGHSRIPVYEESLDHIIGVLYARDLIRLVGCPPEHFNVRSIMRPPLFAPETKPLRDLLRDFMLQKVHIAIISDEYGGVAGLVTIEDILEELVGEISDEHEPEEPAMIKRVSEQLVEADARAPIDELNRLLGLKLPEEAGYHTLGGFIITTIGRIPEVGASFDYAGARYSVLDAEPQKVNRIQIDLGPQAVSDGSTQS